MSAIHHQPIQDKETHELHQPEKPGVPSSADNLEVKQPITKDTIEFASADLQRGNVSDDPEELSTADYLVGSVALLVDYVIAKPLYWTVVWPCSKIINFGMGLYNRKAESAELKKEEVQTASVVSEESSDVVSGPVKTAEISRSSSVNDVAEESSEVDVSQDAGVTFAEHDDLIDVESKPVPFESRDSLNSTASGDTEIMESSDSEYEFAAENPATPLHSSSSGDAEEVLDLGSLSLINTQSAVASLENETKLTQELTDAMRGISQRALEDKLKNHFDSIPGATFRFHLTYEVALTMIPSKFVTFNRQVSESKLSDEKKNFAKVMLTALLLREYTGNSKPLDSNRELMTALNFNTFVGTRFFQSKEKGLLRKGLETSWNEFQSKGGVDACDYSSLTRYLEKSFPKK